MPDLLEAQVEATIEPNVQQDTGDVGIGLLYWMAQSGQIVAPWWSKTRDKQLRAFWKDCDYLGSAFWMIAAKLTSVPFQVEPRDMTIKSHVKQAHYYNSLLHEWVQFGEGWSELWMPFLIDLWTQDNGAFAEVQGDGEPDGPIEGPVIGIRQLDSWRCSRSSNPIFPVVYTATDSKKYKLHYTRVIFSSQMPDPAAEMNRVGHSWITRVINKSQELVDISVYKQEKLGSRPPRQILVGSGISTKSLIGALKMADEDMDNRGLSRFAKTAVVASQRPELALDLIDLVSVPDGFDERTSIELGMYLIALAGGFPPRWLWPAMTTGATKADAMYSHIAGSGGGASWHINMMTRLLAGDPQGGSGMLGKVIPPHLKLVFDYQDDEQDQQKANIRRIRADTREKDLNVGLTDIRTEREQMLKDGELTKAQFADLELEDGRLPNGDDVLTLFVFQDPIYQQFLDLGVDNPLLPMANDPIEMLIAIDFAAVNTMAAAVNGPIKSHVKKAKEALGALAKLKTIYEPLVAPETGEEEEIEEEDEEGIEPEETPPEGKSVIARIRSLLRLKREEKSMSDFALSVRAAIRGLWTGNLDQFGFSESMISAIIRHLRKAWAEGAAECGIKEDELTQDELNARDDFINSQFPHVPSFAADIETVAAIHRESPRDPAGRLGPLLDRGELWIGRYPEARQKGKAMACGNKKLKWKLGEAEHCSSCLKLANKVKRAKFWADRGIFPREAGATYLECRGYKCQCSFEETDEPLSRGRLPNLP